MAGKISRPALSISAYVPDGATTTARPSAKSLAHLYWNGSTTRPSPSIYPHLPFWLRADQRLAHSADPAVLRPEAVVSQLSLVLASHFVHIGFLFRIESDFRQIDRYRRAVGRQRFEHVGKLAPAVQGMVTGRKHFDERLHRHAARSLRGMGEHGNRDERSMGSRNIELPLNV